MLFLTIIILIFIYSFNNLKFSINSVLFRRLCALSFLFAGLLTYNTLYIQSIGSGISLYNGLFEINVITILISLFMCLISSIIILVWPNINIYSPFSSLSARNINLRQVAEEEYSIVILFSVLGGLFLISSSDLLSLYLSIELQSFGLYILATIYKDKLTSTSAGLKYFLLGGLSSSLILLGSGLIYSYTGLTNLESLYNFISVLTSSSSFLAVPTAYEFDAPLLNLDMSDSFKTMSPTIKEASLNFESYMKGIIFGFLLIISGFLFKIAASPFHNWSPDVYDDSPTIVTIWLTIMPKISILILLLEIIIGLNLLSPFIEYSSNLITNLLLISSLLSLIIGAVLGLNQIRIKRLLAYSTINHVGFILLALSINTYASIEAFIFYIIQYTITNLNVFLILLALGYLSNINSFSFPTGRPVDKALKIKEGCNPIEDNKLVAGSTKYSMVIFDINYIKTLKGLFFKNPVLSISLSLSLFSFAGVPPLIGFFAKQQVLYASNSVGYFFISFIAILVSVISASYYLKIIKVITTSPSKSSITQHPEISSGQIEGGLLDRQEHNPEQLPFNSVSSFSLNEQGQASLSPSSPNPFPPVRGGSGDCFMPSTLKDHAIHGGGAQSITNIHCFLIGLFTMSILLFIFNPEILLNTIAIFTSLIIDI